MPPIVFAILTGVQAAIQEAPQILALVQKGKDFFAPLLQGKVINKEQQQKIHDRIDAISEAAQEGKIPDAWEVDADPE